MVRENQKKCPNCGGDLKYYDNVKRIVRTKNRLMRKILIRRLKCERCWRFHRELPDFIIPYKQYEKEVILGVLEGIITSSTFGFEDYPCELTMIRWKNAPNLQVIL